MHVLGQHLHLCTLDAEITHKIVATNSAVQDLGQANVESWCTFRTPNDRLPESFRLIK